MAPASGMRRVARRILASAPAGPEDDADLAPRVDEEFEHLRWFELPPACLAG